MPPKAPPRKSITPSLPLDTRSRRLPPKRMKLIRSCTISVTLLFAGSFGFAENVKLLRTPDDGIQPQAATDGKGAVHLIYFKGDPKAGDIFYVRHEPGQNEFSKPLPVNTQPHTAMAMGTIRGAQLAVGKNGRVHVAWDGMGEGAFNATHPAHSHDPSGHSQPEHDAHPRPAHDSPAARQPLFYTRLNDAATAFEPERNVI